MSDMFSIRNGLKQGDALSPLLFNADLKYTIRRVQVKQVNQSRYRPGVAQRAPGS